MASCSKASRVVRGGHCTLASKRHAFFSRTSPRWALDVDAKRPRDSADMNSINSGRKGIMTGKE